MSFRSQRKTSNFILIQYLLLLTIFFFALQTSFSQSQSQHQHQQPLKILFFGDSIMHCSGVSKNFTSAKSFSYRLPLIRKLLFHFSADHDNEKFITVGPHTGCNKKLDANTDMFGKERFTSEKYAKSDSFFGRSLVEGLNDLPKSLLQYKPDILVFSLGTNDIIRHGWGAERMLVLYEKFFQIVLNYHKTNHDRVHDRQQQQQQEKKKKKTEEFQVLFLSTIPLDVNRPKSVRRYRKANERLMNMNEEVQRTFFGNNNNKIQKHESAATTEMIPFSRENYSVSGFSDAARRQSVSTSIFLLRVDIGFEPRSMTYDAIHPNEIGEHFLAEKIFPSLLKMLMRNKVKNNQVNVATTTSAVVQTAPSFAFLDFEFDNYNPNFFGDKNRISAGGDEGDHYILIAAGAVTILIAGIVAGNVIIRKRRK